MKKSNFLAAFGIAAVLTLCGCQSSYLYTPPMLIPDDQESIPEPESHEILLGEDTFQYSVVLPTERTFDLSRHVRGLIGKPLEALNVDAFGEVQTSSWFTNRNGSFPMTIEEIGLGPNRGSGPEMEGPWVISSAKVEGFTPGFNIKDANGDNFVIKFDPYGYTELSSGAEIVSTKIFHAAGYNVPENYIVVFDPKILKMGEECLMFDELGRICEMTTLDFDRIIEKVQSLPDGRVRAVASKFLDGKPLGGFRYSGTRDDDPNDIVPHEHRRELRGLYVLCAWLKHFDIKNANSLDMYVEQDNKRFIKHYLIDFGSTLGSTTMGPMAPFRGHESEVDTGAAFKNLFTLGLHVKDWEKAGDVRFPTIGRFDMDDFDPGNVIMNYPNPALLNKTNLDCYWAAKLVMSFSDEQLRAIVREGQYSDPNAEAYLWEMLKRRRDIIGRYYYSRINSLDKFEILNPSEDFPLLSFTDMGIQGKLWKLENSRYRYSLHINGKEIKKSALLTDQATISMEKLLSFAQYHPAVPADLSTDDQWRLTLWISRDHGSSWGKWVKVYFRFDPDLNKLTLRGVERQG